LINKGLFSSNTEMWGTPQALFNQLNDEFHFDLDVCAIKENAKCDKFFSPEDDGLKQSWYGKCFMNPPYGKEIKFWIEKAYNEILNNKNVNLVVALLPARTDTKYFHNYILSFSILNKNYNKILNKFESEIRFIKGRLKFNDGKGLSSGPAPFPSMIVIWKKI
jgi:phage N-6-adenine-methyltransferase